MFFDKQNHWMKYGYSMQAADMCLVPANGNHKGWLSTSEKRNDIYRVRWLAVPTVGLHIGVQNQLKQRILLTENNDAAWKTVLYEECRDEHSFKLHTITNNQL